jgi:hypothetical protein
MTEYLHIHSPATSHDHSFIIGNRASLEALRDAIDSALAEGAGKATCSVADGEEFDICVYKEDDLLYWDKATFPYRDYEGSNREDAITPWDLFRKYK